MRNLKRVLSLALTVAFMIGLMATSAGAVFKDADKIVHTEAVDMCTALGIIQGFEDGNYKPEQGVTRAEMSKMITIIMNRGTDPNLSTPTPATYSDITGHWAAKYIEYCTDLGIVAGMGDKTFAPNAGVTGTQAAKMLLVALGYDADVEKFNGPTWMVSINVRANQRHLYDELSAIDPNAPLSRDSAAQMIWNALQANEVEYEYKVITKDGQVVTQAVLKDKTDGTKDNANITLMEDKFGAFETVATMTGYSWDDKKGEFTYNFTEFKTVPGLTAPATAPTTFSVSAKESYTEFFGMNVKIIHKGETKISSVYGMVAEDSAVLAAGSIGDIAAVTGSKALTELEFAGTNYKVGYTVTSSDAKTDLPIVNENQWPTNNTLVKIAATELAPYEAYLIDWNDDGKADYITVVPFEWAEVTSVNTTSVNLKSGIGSGTTITSATFESDYIYDGVAKGDYVQILKAANSAYTGNELVKLTAVNGKVDRVEKDTAGTITKARVDGATWYKAVTTATPTSTLGNVVTDKNYDLYVAGSYALFADLADESTLDDLLYVSVADGDSFSVKAKVHFTDGTSNVITVSKLDGKAVTKTDAANMLGKLFTFVKNGDTYELTPVGTNNKVGFGEASTPAVGSIVGKNESANPGKATVGSTPYSFADDAVVFITYKDGDNGVVTKVITGSQAKNLGSTVTDPAGTMTVLFDKSGTVNTAGVVALYAPAATSVTGAGDTGNYGYVVSNASFDGSKVYFKAWNGTKIEEYMFKSSSNTVKQGQLVRFDLVADSTENEVSNLKEVATIATSEYPNQAVVAITGAEIGSDGKGTINVADVANKVGTLAGTSVKVTDETKYMFVDSKSKENGFAGGAADVTFVDKTGGGYMSNAYVIVNSSNEVVFIAVDKSADNTFNYVP